MPNTFKSAIDLLVKQYGSEPEYLRDTSIGPTEAASRLRDAFNISITESSVRRWRARNVRNLTTPSVTPEAVAETKPARVLIYDIETSFQIGGFFGPRYNTNIAKVIQPTYVLGFAWKWLGEDEIHTDYIWDHERYNTDPRNDIAVVNKWRHLVSQADILVGHNVEAFDNKVMMARAIVHGLPPIDLPQSADTLKIARRVARFDGNKLDELGSLLGYGRKIHTNIDLWWDCMNGDEEAQEQMREYNIRDVDLTEAVYDHLKPYDTRHPNLATIEGRFEACPKCGIEGKLSAQGVRRTKVATYQRFKCGACFSWVRARISDKGRPVYV